MTQVISNLIGTFVQLTHSADGEYTCIGKNKYGESKGTASLKVRSEFDLWSLISLYRFPSEATFVVPFEAQEEERVAGGTISLPCEAQVDDR